MFKTQTSHGAAPRPNSFLTCHWQKLVAAAIWLAGASLDIDD